MTPVKHDKRKHGAGHRLDSKIGIGSGSQIEKTPNCSSKKQDVLKVENCTADILGGCLALNPVVAILLSTWTEHGGESKCLPLRYGRLP